MQGRSNATVFMGRCTKGIVQAAVQGSRARPYRVGTRIKPLSERDSVRVEKVMAGRALFMRASR